MNLEELVVSIVRENMEEKREVDVDSDLREGLGLDSFGTIIIVNALEDAFGITIDEADFRDVRTIRDAVDLLRTRYHVQAVPQ